VRIPLETTKDTRDSLENPSSSNSGPGEQNSRQGRVETLIAINHEQEVNKARYMPQSPNIIATKVNNGEVHLFDYFKHTNTPSDK
jgi:histone-binding protein RBBP4